MSEQRPPADLAAGIIRADMPSRQVTEKPLPNAAAGPLAILLHPFRGFLLVPMLVTIVVLIVVSVRW
jgi:hypothetical protein